MTPTETARYWMSRNPLFLDTETTGLDDAAEIVDIAIIDSAGQPLINTLVRPRLPIPPGAQAVHGISNEMVRQAPAFGELWPEVRRLLSGRLVIIYNADYDTRMIRQSLGNLPLQWDTLTNGAPEYDCAMLAYAAHYGDWNDYRGSYRWQKLGDAARQCRIPLPADLHRAAADAELARLIVKHMAAQV
jgi:DNA polymerase-3 subunit epsilon